MNNKRNISFDILRILACFMIIADHTAGGFMINTPYNRWWLLLDFYFFLSKPAVALFFMLSGSLLLKKEESARNWFNKRVLRIILVIVIFTIPHGLISHDFGLDFIAYLRCLWSFNSGSYWYLYSYLGIMVTLPILRKLVKSLEEWEYLLGFGLWFVFISIIPQLQTDCGLYPFNPNFSLGVFGVSSFVFFIMGHYFANVCTYKFTFRSKLCLSFLSIVALLYATLVTRYEYMNIDSANNFLSLDKFDAPTSAIVAITLFISTVSYEKNKIEKAQATNELTPSNSKNVSTRIITQISASTFGIYLLSDNAIQLLLGTYQKLLSLGLEVVFACILYDLYVFITLLIIVSILRFIPGIKKLI